MPERPQYCPACGKELALETAGDETVCPFCGEELPLFPLPELEEGEASSICLQCRHAYDAGHRYCTFDGKALLPIDGATAVCTHCQREYGLHVEQCPMDGHEVVLTWPQDFQRWLQENTIPDNLEFRTGMLSLAQVLGEAVTLFKEQRRNYLFYGLRILLISVVIALASTAAVLLLGQWGTVLSLAAVAYYTAQFSLALMGFSLRQQRGVTLHYEDFFRPIAPAVRGAMFAYVLFALALSVVGGRSLLLWFVNLAFVTTTFFVLPLLASGLGNLTAALQESLRAVQLIWWEVFSLVGIMAMVNMIGLLFFGLGTVMTLPWSICLQACAYRQIWKRRQKG